LRKPIGPRLGDLRVEEATPGCVQEFINTVDAEQRQGEAKTCRSVLSGMFGIAVRSGVSGGSSTPPFGGRQAPRRRQRRGGSVVEPGASGPSDVHVARLRKTCATALDVAGVSARGIAECPGHKRPR
jgi:hypothetical protein